MQTRIQKTRRALGSVIAAAILLHQAIGLAQSYTITPTPFQVVQDDSGKIVVGGCVWTYAAGTTTPIGTYTNTSVTLNSNPIIADYAGRFTAYLVAGTNYKFVYEQACTPPAHATVLRTADFIAGVPVTAGTIDVVGTAGENIALSDAVYVSDGSGGKTAGSWYRTSSNLPYSSTTATTIGIATVAITSGQTGLIRIAGRVTGLSLVSGAAYYLRTVAGSITSTWSNGARLIGQADSTTSLIVANNPPIQYPVEILACGRLTASTSLPVTISDQTAVTVIYYTPINGCNQVTLWNGTQLVTDILTNTPYTVDASVSQMYDVFASDSSGVVNVETLAWTNDTTRATGLAMLNGFLCKSGDATRRYIGSYRTTAVNGQTEDSQAKRYIWNMYNRVRRPLLVQDATATWAYTTATLRQARATATNQVDVIVGWADTPIEVWVQAVASNNATIGVQVGIGEDSTTTIATGVTGGGGLTEASGLQNGPSMTARLFKYPFIGRHYYPWLEWSTATGATTWYGTPGTLAGPTGSANGIGGWIEG